MSYTKKVFSESQETSTFKQLLLNLTEVELIQNSYMIGVTIETPLNWDYGKNQSWWVGKKWCI